MIAEKKIDLHYDAAAQQGYERKSLTLNVCLCCIFPVET